jgi:hypothetical protein
VVFTTHPHLALKLYSVEPYCYFPSVPTLLCYASESFLLFLLFSFGFHFTLGPIRYVAKFKTAVTLMYSLHSAFHSAGPARRFKFKMFDSEKFICEVEARPPLCNVQLKEYSNIEVKATCWAEYSAS